MAQVFIYLMLAVLVVIDVVHEQTHGQYDNILMIPLAVLALIVCGWWSALKSKQD